MNRRGPLAGLAVAVLAGSIAPVLIRWSRAPSVAIVFYRLVFTSLFVAPAVLLWFREDLLALSRRDALAAAAAGAAMGVQLSAFFESIRWTSVAAAVTIAQTQTLFVAVGAYLLLDERITARTVLGVAVAFLGVAGMVTGGLVSPDLLVGADPLLGNALALAAGALFAGYLLAGRSLRARVHLFPYVLVISAVAALVVLGLALADGTAVAPAAYPPREWAIFLGVALGPGLVTHTLINWSLKYLESSAVSVTLLLFPVVSTAYGVALLGEVPDPVTVAGGAVVLAGIYVTLSSTGPAA